MPQRSILVTGGAGYIGGPVCAALKKRGYTPITLDNLSRGYRQTVKYGPLIEGDIGDADLIQKTCAAYEPLAAMHFAALIEVGESVQQPALYLSNNFEKAKTLFTTLAECGVTNVVFSSTAGVYGIPEKAAPIAEEAAPNPINPYGDSKLKAETFLRAQSNMRSVVLRYFNAAGASQDGLGEAHNPETHLIPNALLAMLDIKPALTVYGQDYPTADGTAIRDYIHVEDLAEAHCLALDYLLLGGMNQIINLGSGTGHSVKDILTAIEKTAGKAVPHSYGPRRAGDPPFLVADNKKATSILKWRPQRGLNEIIASAWQWHQSATYKELISKKG